MFDYCKLYYATFKWYPCFSLLRSVIQDLDCQFIWFSFGSSDNTWLLRYFSHSMDLCVVVALNIWLLAIYGPVLRIFMREGMEVTKMKSVVGFCIVMELLLMSKVTVGRENKIEVVDCAQKPKTGKKAFHSRFSLYDLLWPRTTPCQDRTHPPFKWNNLYSLQLYIYIYIDFFDFVLDTSAKK